LSGSLSGPVERGYSESFLRQCCKGFLRLYKYAYEIAQRIVEGQILCTENPMMSAVEYVEFESQVSGVAFKTRAT
jgi:hypothetical protein